MRYFFALLFNAFKKFKLIGIKLVVMCYIYVTTVKQPC